VIYTVNVLFLSDPFIKCARTYMHCRCDCHLHRCMRRICKLCINIIIFVHIVWEPILREWLFFWHNEHKSSLIAFSRGKYSCVLFIFHSSLLCAIRHNNQFRLPIHWSCMGASIEY
jgi:hypothetical protein